MKRAAFAPRSPGHDASGGEGRLRFRLLQRVLIILGAAAVLLFLVAGAALLFVDADLLKPRLEKVASDALGMKVRVGGKLGLHLFPAPNATIAGGSVLDERGTVVASAKNVRLWIDLLPLFRGEWRLRNLEVEQPRLTIERDPQGDFNIERLRSAATLLGMLQGGGARLSNGSVSFLDRRTGDGLEVTGLDLTVRRVNVARGGPAPVWSNLSLEGDLSCQSIRTKRLFLTPLRFSVQGERGVFEIKPVALRLFGGEGTGALRADLSGHVPRYRLQCSLPRFRIEEFLRTLSPKAAAEGEMDFSASLSLEGNTWASMRQSLSGAVSMRGEHLTLIGTDLDRALARYASSQGFNLVDVGAVFLAGPFGLAITKGYNFATLFRSSGDSSSIRTVVSDWKVERGVAHAVDVALATRRNRFALRGGLDLVNERFADVTVAVVDGRGCPRTRQTIRGSFDAPVVEKPHMLMSLSGPVRKLYRQSRGLFPSGHCEVFYSGSVSPDL